MRRIKPRIIWLSILMIIALLLCFSATLAETKVTGIQQRIEDLQQTKGFRLGENQSNCFKFARKVFNEIFHCGKAAEIKFHGDWRSSYKSTNLVCRLFTPIDSCVHKNCNGKLAKVSQYALNKTLGAVNLENVTALFKLAKPGDVLQTVKRNGGVHTAIIQSVDPNKKTVVLYHGGYSMKAGQQQHIAMTTNRFHNYSNYHCVSLYRAKNYDEIEAGYTAQYGKAAPKATIIKTANEEYRIQVPAKTRVDLYANALDTVPTGSAFESASKGFFIYCEKTSIASDGTIWCYIASKYGKQMWFIQSSSMTRKENWSDTSDVVVKFFLYGGTMQEDKSLQRVIGQPYGTLPVPTKPGYEFIGWYYDDARILPETIVSTGHNHILHAKWQVAVGEEPTVEPEATPVPEANATTQIDWQQAFQKLIKENAEALHSNAGTVSYGLYDVDLCGIPELFILVDDGMGNYSSKAVTILKWKEEMSCQIVIDTAWAFADASHESQLYLDADEEDSFGEKDRISVLSSGGVQSVCLTNYVSNGRFSQRNDWIFFYQDGSLQMQQLTAMGEYEMTDDDAFPWVKTYWFCGNQISESEYASLLSARIQSAEILETRSILDIFCSSFADAMTRNEGDHTKPMQPAQTETEECLLPDGRYLYAADTIDFAFDAPVTLSNMQLEYSSGLNMRKLLDLKPGDSIQYMGRQCTYSGCIIDETYSDGDTAYSMPYDVTILLSDTPANIKARFYSAGSMEEDLESPIWFIQPGLFELPFQNDVIICDSYFVVYSAEAGGDSDSIAEVHFPVEELQSYLLKNMQYVSADGLHTLIIGALCVEHGVITEFSIDYMV